MGSYGDRWLQCCGDGCTIRGKCLLPEYLGGAPQLTDVDGIGVLCDQSLQLEIGSPTRSDSDEQMPGAADELPQDQQQALGASSGRAIPEERDDDDPSLDQQHVHGTPSRNDERMFETDH